MEVFLGGQDLAGAFRAIENGDTPVLVDCPKCKTAWIKAPQENDPARLWDCPFCGFRGSLHQS